MSYNKVDRKCRVCKGELTVNHLVSDPYIEFNRQNGVETTRLRFRQLCRVAFEEAEGLYAIPTNNPPNEGSKDKTDSISGKLSPLLRALLKR